MVEVSFIPLSLEEMEIKMKVWILKLPKSTRLFRKGQKVWLQSTTGAQAARVCGKHRGKGRYISAWIHWNDFTMDSCSFKEIEVDDSFAIGHDLLRSTGRD